MEYASGSGYDLGYNNLACGEMLTEHRSGHWALGSDVKPFARHHGTPD
jgi:hypothetical protein